MKCVIPFCVVVLAISSLWAQNESTPEPALSGETDRMSTPPPVSGLAYPVLVGDQERSNYLRGGLAFTSAYTDNALGGVMDHPISDISYSVAPYVALDETTTRLHCLLTYAPGFTFYQRTSARNEADQNASIEVEYRLSPHVTFSAVDGFQKSSNVFNQPDLAGAGAVSGGIDSANFSVIAPIADRLSNTGTVGIADQLSFNSMVGASGTFSNLHYPDPSQVPGLYDAGSQSGLAFYSLRFARGQYVGATYQYQRLLSYPTSGNNETQTHAMLFFYTIQPDPRFSLSFFGGPQYSDTVSAPEFHVVPSHSWQPAGGASFNWQSRLSNFALGYTHIVAGGSGLVGAVQMDSATASFRQQIARRFSAGVAGGYTQNNVIGGFIAAIASGHSISAGAYLQRQFGEHLNAQAGYTRLHQSYSNITVFATTPDTNREYVSLAYQFSRPLGR